MTLSRHNVTADSNDIHLSSYLARSVDTSRHLFEPTSSFGDGACSTSPLSYISVTLGEEVHHQSSLFNTNQIVIALNIPVIVETLKELNGMPNSNNDLGIPKIIRYQLNARSIANCHWAFDSAPYWKFRSGVEISNDLFE